MLATQDKYINEAALKLHKLIEDQKFRDQLWAREDYIRREKGNYEYLYGEIDTLKKSNSEMKATIADMATTITDKDAEIASLRAQLASLKSTT